MNINLFRRRRGLYSYRVAQHEADARRQVARGGERLDAREVLVHEPAAALRVQHAAAGAHELRQALQVLVVLGGRAPRQQVLDASMQDGLG